MIFVILINVSTLYILVLSMLYLPITSFMTFKHNNIYRTIYYKWCYSSLFADDLSTIFIFKKPGRIEATIKKYLENLVKWLYKWRLKMNASKCNVTIFSGNGSRNETKFELYINQCKIPYAPNSVFLGITFDEFLNFRVHTEGLAIRARKRLNIIKILSNLSWILSHETLNEIKNALIGSLFVYSFFSVAIIAETNLDRLQKVQNRAIQSIYRLEWTSPTDLIHSMSNLLLVRGKRIFRRRLAITQMCAFFL